MKKLFATTLTVLAAAVTGAVAQTSTTAPSTAPPAQVAPSTTSSTMTMTDEEAKAWVNKVVYSSDDKNLGEVAAIARDSSGKVSELHADIGGFLGIAETRVRVMPAEFSLKSDRVVLNLTAEAAKALPRIAK